MLIVDKRHKVDVVLPPDDEEARAGVTVWVTIASISEVRRQQ